MANPFEKFREEMEYREAVQAEMAGQFGAGTEKYSTPRYLKDLPSKRQFYEFLNGLAQDVYQKMVDQFPNPGQHKYKNRRTGQPIKRFHNGQSIPLPDNSGRMKAAHVKPGRIHVRGLASGGGKAGRISFIVNSDTVYDPVFQENYYDKLLNNPFTDFTTERVSVGSAMGYEPNVRRKETPVKKSTGVMIMRPDDVRDPNRVDYKDYIKEFNKRARIKDEQKRSDAAYKAIGYEPHPKEPGMLVKVKTESKVEFVKTQVSQMPHANKYFQYTSKAAESMAYQLKYYAEMNRYSPAYLGGKKIEDTEDPQLTFGLFREAFGDATLEDYGTIPLSGFWSKGPFD